MIAKEFAHYRVHSCIGQGGMGEVYVAEDLTLDRTRRAQVSPAGDAGEPRDSAGPEVEGRSRLLREARAAAQLDHPFICKVYEVGEHDGRAFFAMEFVEGVTLKAHLASGRLTTTKRCGSEPRSPKHSISPTAGGVVHRDVKPANVMLAADGHVKVMDFGVAKRVSAPFVRRGRRPRARLRRPCRASPRARSPTCHRSSFAASRSTPVPTCSRSACCSTNC